MWHILRATEMILPPPHLVGYLISVFIHPIGLFYNDLLILPHFRTRKNWDPYQVNFGVH